MAVTLVNTNNVGDVAFGIFSELAGASSLTTFAFDGKTFLCVGAVDDKQGFHDQKGELHFVKKAGFAGRRRHQRRWPGRLQIEVHNVGKLVAGDFVL